MTSVLISLLAMLRGVVWSRAALHLEVLALRHQLHVVQRSRPRRLRLARADRWLWARLSHVWTGWRTALVIVKPRRRRLASQRLSPVLDVEESSAHRSTACGRRCARVDSEDGARQSGVGAPRIHGEL